MKTLNHFSSGIVKGIATFAFAVLLSSNAFSQMAFNRPVAAEMSRIIYNSGKSDIMVAISDSEGMMMLDMVFIEDWMTDPFEWNHETSASPDILNEVLIEEELEIESWMVDLPWISSFSDEEIPIENWMTSPVEWSLVK